MSFTREIKASVDEVLDDRTIVCFSCHKVIDAMNNRCPHCHTILKRNDEEDE